LQIIKKDRSYKSKLKFLALFMSKEIRQLAIVSGKGGTGKTTIAAVCINKYDLNFENALQIEYYCKEIEARPGWKIPYDSKVVKALVQRKTVIEFPCQELGKIIQRIWGW